LVQISLAPLAALSDRHGHLGPVVRPRRHVFDHSHNFHALNHLPKHDVLVVQEIGRRARDEELTTIAIRARIGHGEQARPIMFQRERLVVEALAVDRNDAGAITVQKITSLNHEILDDAVEGGALVAYRLPLLLHLSSAELPEVLCSLWANVGEKLELYAAHRLAAIAHVEKHDRIRFVR